MALTEMVERELGRSGSNCARHGPARSASRNSCRTSISPPRSIGTATAIATSGTIAATSPRRSAIICKIAAGGAASRCSTKCVCRTASTTRSPTARSAASPIGVERGVRARRWRATGAANERSLQAQLFLPAGANGPALMLHPNFGVIRRYNNSDRYALVVALLARAFDGRSGSLVRELADAGRLAQPRTDARTANAAERPGLRRRRRRTACSARDTRAPCARSKPTRAWRRTASRPRRCSTASASRAGVTPEPRARAARPAARRHSRTAALAQSPGLQRRPRRRRDRRAHARRDPRVRTRARHGSARPRDGCRAGSGARRGGLRLASARVGGGPSTIDVAQAPAHQREHRHRRRAAPRAMSSGAFMPKRS